MVEAKTKLLCLKTKLKRTVFGKNKGIPKNQLGINLDQNLPTSTVNMSNCPKLITKYSW